MSLRSSGPELPPIFPLSYLSSFPCQRKGLDDTVFEKVSEFGAKWTSSIKVVCQAILLKLIISSPSLPFTVMR